MLFFVEIGSAKRAASREASQRRRKSILYRAICNMYLRGTIVLYEFVGCTDIRNNLVGVM